MPNPFLTPEMNTGQAAPERPKPDTPILENYSGDNNAYRGIEPHGVHPTGHFYDVQPITPDDAIAEYEPPKPPPDPIPVRIVQDGSRETVMPTVRHEYAQPTTATRILGRNLKRRACRISNLHATDTVYVSPDPSVQQYIGYPIKPGAEFVYNAYEPLWAVAGSTNQIEMAIYSEIAVDE